MTIQQLRYFLALCQDLNYTRTAGRLYLSRQALRLSIAALENELCGPLFTNVRNHLVLTEKGQRFRAQAAPVVEQFDRMCAQAYQDIRSPALRLGISVALVPSYLPMLGDVLEQFRQQYPGIPLETTLLSNDAVCAQLQNGTLDAGLVMDLGGCAAGLARTALTRHTAALLVPRCSPFWGRSSIAPAELDGQLLLVPGLAPEPLAPLWNTLRQAGARPKVEIGEQYYRFTAPRSATVWPWTGWRSPPTTAWTMFRTWHWTACRPSAPPFCSRSTQSTPVSGFYAAFCRNTCAIYERRDPYAFLWNHRPGLRQCRNSAPPCGRRHDRPAHEPFPRGAGRTR